MKNIEKDLFKNLTLLYVEDDDMTIEEISFFLKKYVKKLLIAKNGQEGIDLFKSHNPDMIISDIQMPTKNGLDMCEEILKLRPDIPIVLTTAYSDGDYLIKAIELGIDKYLLKPINMIEMLAVIQKSLNLGTINNLTREFDDYIQFILDSNPSFMFILHGEKIEYANKKFLELLGYEDINSLKKSSEDCINLFKFEELETTQNWLDYIAENSEKTYLVSLVSGSKTHMQSKFYVSYKYFESTNKSVLAFVDIQNHKLKKIEDISKQLLGTNIRREDFILGMQIINKISSVDK